MNTCKKCCTTNEAGVKYCQQCGSEIVMKKSFFKIENFKLWAGFNVKGGSIAPLACMGIEKQAEKELGKVSTIPHLTHVRPKEDGSWFCPDCGELNPAHARNCKGCGRDFV